MRLLHRLTGGLRALVRQQRDELELDEELRAYLEEAAARHVAAGMSREQAFRAARAEIGSLEAVKDYTRESGWESRLDTLWRDLRYAARALRRAPAFAMTAVVTLALGIGANTAIFSVVNAVMLRPLPVERPHELIALAAVYPRGTDAAFSYAAYRQFASEGAAVIDTLAASSLTRSSVVIDRTPEPVRYKRVSGNYFSVLGVPAAAGRTLVPGDDRLPTGEPVAVLTHAYWTNRFGSDPAAVGRTIRLDGAAFTVVGVAPPGFFGESVGDAPDFWIPLTAQRNTPAYVWTGHSTTWLAVLGRLRAGITVEQARAALELVYARVRQDIATGMEPEFRNAVVESGLRVSDASTGAPRLREFFARPLQVLMATSGLVLLIACANVASLVLARAARRRREVAVCLALGAARGRIVRQLLAEAWLVSALGAAAGVLLAMWGTSALARLAAGSALSLSLDLGPDARVLLFTTLVAIATAILCGLLPGLRATRVDVSPALKHAGSTRAIARVPFGRTLVATQVAISVIVLVAAGLFVRSLLKLRDVNIGFDADRVLMLQMTAPTADPPPTPQERRDLYRRLLARAEQVAGVGAASVSATGAFTTNTWGNAITIDGVAPPPDAPHRTFANAVGARYFEVMGLTVLRGRAFSDRDAEGAPPVAMINETFARRFFGAADPIGRRVGLGAPARQMMTVVGVAENAKYVNVREDDRPMLYVPFTQHDQVLRSLEVRAMADPSALVGSLRQALSGVDPRVAVVAAAQLTEQVDASMVAERLIARLSAAFGLLALGLAAVGLYGLTAYVTAQRSLEFGIRMALGSGGNGLRWLVARDLMLLAGTGAAIGLPVALVAARIIASQLYQTAPTDPIAIAGGLVTLAIATLAAGYVPARRAERIDPLVALRCE